ncbi:Protein vts1 [Bienertia sinuspersici]
MRAHLFRVGIDPDYNPWIFHGEGHSLEGTDQEMSKDEGDDFEDEDPLVSDDLASLAKFALGEGSHIDKALKIQCSSLYKHWRERLKSENFSKCKSLKEAERACPAGVDIDQWKWLVYNYWNSHKMREVEAEASFEADNEGDSGGNASNFTASEQTQADAKPVYVKLRRKTKYIDDEGEVKFNELKKMHEKEIQEKGIDSLSIDEAYMKVLGHCSGYARGLGKGHPLVAKDGKKGKAELEAETEQLRGDNTAMQAKLEFLIAENQRKEKPAREKEEALEKKLELIMNTLGL